MWRGTGSLAEGVSTCRPCRREGRGSSARFADLICKVCGKQFTHDKAGSIGGFRRATCGSVCESAQKAANARKRYADLSEDERRERRLARWRRKNALRRGAERSGPTISIRQLGDRDGWRCHLCRKPVNPRLRAPHRMSPTFDHLVPVSLGGSDDPSNLKLAHFTCNSSRGTVQLQLFG